MTTIRTFGRYPTLGEMKAYYTRDDVLDFLYAESQLRNFYAAFRKQSWEIHPTSKDHLRGIIDEVIQNRIEKVYQNPPDSIRLKMFDYLSFHSPKRITARGKLIGFDLIFEVDLPGWRRSFEALSGVIRLLDDFEVCYRMKYSGVRSLHLIIPFEALPKTFNGESILRQHEEIAKKVRSYFSQYCGMKKACGTQFLRMAYSLNEDNGLVSLPLTSEELPHFRPWQTHLHNNVIVDKLWHGDVPTGAWRKTLSFLRKVYSDTKPKGRIQFGFPIVSKIADSHCVSRFTFHDLAEKLRSDDEATRVEAAWHLMTSPFIVPSEALKVGLADENPDIRWYLTEALQKNLDPEACQLAVKMLLDKDQFVRISAADVTMLAGADALDLLSDVLTSANSLAHLSSDNLLYVIGKQIMRFIEKTGNENQLAVIGQKVAKIIEKAIDREHSETPVRRWIKEIRTIGGSFHHIEPIALFLPTIQWCLRKLAQSTDETEIERQPYVGVLGEICRSDALPLLAIHAIANTLSIADLEIPTNSRIRKERTRIQPLLEAIVADFSLEEKMRILIRFVLYGKSRSSDAATELLMKIRMSESIGATIRSIAKNLWSGSINRLMQTEPRLAEAIATQIDKGTRIVFQLNDAKTPEALIESLKNISVLIASLRNRRQRTAKALAWMDGPTQEIVPVLIEALKDEDKHTRYRAINALGQIGDRVAIPPLIEALGDPSKSVRNHAIFALSQIGQPAVPALIDALRKADRRIPSHAVLALGKIGDAIAVPALIEALGNPSMIFNATQALGNIGDPRAVPALIERLSDDNLGIRQKVTEVLGKIGTPEAKQALEAI